MKTAIAKRGPKWLAARYYVMIKDSKNPFGYCKYVHLDGTVWPSMSTGVERYAGYMETKEQAMTVADAWNKEHGK